MSCHQIQSLFSDHLDGVLSADDEDRLGAHLAACADCRAALARLETPLQELSGAAPAPPPALLSRTLAAARREGLLARRPWARPRLRWLLPLAAGLVLFAAGYASGRRVASPVPAGSDFTVLPASCSTDLVPALDEAALRTAPPPRAFVSLAARRGVRVPKNLLSHGPYTALRARTLEQEGGSCVPLTAAYGDTLVLLAVPAAERAAGGFVVETDPRRVLYARVRWVKAGVAFSLEGRAEGRELLELAQEIAARTRVLTG